MSSSSSDSDSDEFEPIRKIKINIRPRDEAIKRSVADVNEIKASVKAWRPLGPPTHPSLSRRQSSLSSVSSLTFGTSNSVYGNSNQNASNPANSQELGGGGVTSMRSSPSCSSLVNEFNNRSSFTNFMSSSTTNATATISRTSSPLTLINHHNSDPVPIAIAIQESIDLIIRGHYDPSAREPKFNSRYLGNIKVAFPNAFARGNLSKQAAMPAALKLRLNPTENIIRYYASRLIKDLDLGTTTNNVAERSTTDAFFGNEQNNSNSINGDNSKKRNLLDLSLDPFLETKQISSSNANQASAPNFRVVEFDMDALINHLRKMYDQSPNSRYYNVDVLRYQISPIQSIKECPLQVCAYWKVEANLVKLRIDFKHSSKSGLNLERLREINFTVNFSQFIPPGIDVKALSPDSFGLNNNNNNSGAMNMNNFEPSGSLGHNKAQRSGVSLIDSVFDQTETLGDGIPLNSSGSHHRIHEKNPTHITQLSNSHLKSSNSQLPPGQHRLPELALNSTEFGNSNNILQSSGSSSQTMSGQTDSWSNSQHQQVKPAINNIISPYITYEPQAHWDKSIKQLSWKFDTLLSYYKTDGLGSLFAKLDFRNYHGMPSKFLENCKPTPVDVKFLIIDSTLSKIGLSIDSMGYKMSLLKKEIRSGRYKSEPYIL